MFWKSAILVSFEWRHKMFTLQITIFLGLTSNQFLRLALLVSSFGPSEGYGFESRPVYFCIDISVTYIKLNLYHNKLTQLFIEPSYKFHFNLRLSDKWKTAIDFNLCDEKLPDMTTWRMLFRPSACCPRPWRRRWRRRPGPPWTGPRSKWRPRWTSTRQTSSRPWSRCLGCQAPRSDISYSKVYFSSYEFETNIPLKHCRALSIYQMMLWQTNLSFWIYHWMVWHILN